MSSTIFLQKKEPLPFPLRSILLCITIDAQNTSTFIVFLQVVMNVFGQNTVYHHLFDEVSSRRIDFITRGPLIQFSLYGLISNRSNSDNLLTFQHFQL